MEVGSAHRVIVPTGRISNSACLCPSVVNFRIVVLDDAISGLNQAGREELENIGVWVVDTETCLADAAHAGTGKRDGMFDSFPSPPAKEVSHLDVSVIAQSPA